jgi:hypothetical protein
VPAFSSAIDPQLATTPLLAVQSLVTDSSTAIVRAIGALQRADQLTDFRVARQIGIRAAVTRRRLPHHRVYGSVHGSSSPLR